VHMQTPSFLETGLLVMLFCLTGGILTSRLLGLSLQADYWILCTATLMVTCEVFMLGEGLRSGRRRLELVLLALSSAAVPFVLGFVTILSTNDEPLHVAVTTVAILFVLSLLWPAYIMFYLARELRFKEFRSEADSAADSCGSRSCQESGCEARDRSFTYEDPGATVTTSCQATQHWSTTRHRTAPTIDSSRNIHNWAPERNTRKSGG
jgi:hypothetical protein